MLRGHTLTPLIKASPVKIKNKKGRGVEIRIPTFLTFPVLSFWTVPWCPQNKSSVPNLQDGSLIFTGPEQGHSARCLNSSLIQRTAFSAGSAAHEYAARSDTGRTASVGGKAKPICPLFPHGSLTRQHCTGRPCCSAWANSLCLRARPCTASSSTDFSGFQESGADLGATQILFSEVRCLRGKPDCFFISSQHGLQI